MIPFKHNYQRQHHNSIQTESLALEVRGVQMVKTLEASDQHRNQPPSIDRKARQLI